MGMSTANKIMDGTGATFGSLTYSKAETSTTSTQVLSSMHQDYVHHVAFDIYGRRMVTCSKSCALVPAVILEISNIIVGAFD